MGKLSFALPAGVAAIERSINKLNNKYRSQTAEYLLEVGMQLKDAQERLAKHKSGFGEWCEVKWGWTSKHCRRLIVASEVVQQLNRLKGPNGPIDVASTLPECEAHYREIAAVPTEKQGTFWIWFSQEKGERPITAELIKSHVKTFLQPSKNGPSNYQEDESESDGESSESETSEDETDTIDATSVTQVDSTTSTQIDAPSTPSTPPQAANSVPSPEVTTTNQTIATSPVVSSTPTPIQSVPVPVVVSKGYVKGATYVFDGQSFVLITSDNVSTEDRIAAVESILASDGLVKMKIIGRSEANVIEASRGLKDKSLLSAFKSVKESRTPDFNKLATRIFETKEPDPQKAFKEVWKECGHQARFDLLELVEKLWKEEAKSTKVEGELIDYDPRQESLTGKIDTPEFHARWLEWCDYREHTVGRPMTPPMAKDILRFLKKQGRVETAIKFLEQTIDSGKVNLVSKLTVKKAMFTPPNLETITAYGIEAGIFENKSEARTQCDKFYTFYASQGWVFSNGQPMVDWKMALRRWSDQKGVGFKGYNGYGTSGKDYSERLDAAYKGDPAKLEKLTEEEKEALRNGNT